MDKRVWKTAEKFDTIGDVSVASPWANCNDIPEVETIDISTPWLDRKVSRIYAWNGSFLLSSDIRKNPIDRMITNFTVDDILSSDVEPDLVVCECLQLGNAARQIAQRWDAPLLVNQHNSEFEIVEQFLKDQPLPDRLAERLVNNLYVYEQQMIDVADGVVFQSPNNVEDFDLSAVDLYDVIPNGTNVDGIRSSDPDAVPVSELSLDPSRPSCIFVGAFDYQPNRLAADIIADVIAPACPDIQFLLVGRNPPTYEVANIYTPGFVDDLGAYLQYADIALCPLTMGSGTKLKMLDYLAAGLPIVSTPRGTQGLSITDGEHAIVVDSPVDFPDVIQSLSDAPERQKELGSNGFQLADHYSWDTLLQEYEDIVKALIE